MTMGGSWLSRNHRHGFDRVEVAPGIVKRVYQAVYAKLLVAEDEVQWPDPKNMTPRAHALFELLFADRP